MANWIDLYRSKLTTPEQAVSVVESGDWIDYGWCVNTPRVLDAALAKRYEELEDVKVRGGVTMWMPEIAKAGRRRGPLHLELLALLRHRPEGHRQGMGFLRPHALL